MCCTHKPLATQRTACTTRGARASAHTPPYPPPAPSSAERAQELPQAPRNTQRLGGPRKPRLPLITLSFRNGRCKSARRHVDSRLRRTAPGQALLRACRGDQPRSDRMLGMRGQHLPPMRSRRQSHRPDGVQCQPERGSLQAPSGPTGRKPELGRRPRETVTMSRSQAPPCAAAPGQMNPRSVTTTGLLLSMQQSSRVSAAMPPVSRRGAIHLSCHAYADYVAARRSRRTRFRRSPRPRGELWWISSAAAHRPNQQPDLAGPARRKRRIFVFARARSRWLKQSVPDHHQVNGHGSDHRTIEVGTLREVLHGLVSTHGAQTPVGMTV